MKIREFISDTISNVMEDYHAFKMLSANLFMAVRDRFEFGEWSPPDKFPEEGDECPGCDSCPDTRLTFVKIEAAGLWLYACSEGLSSKKW